MDGLELVDDNYNFSVAYEVEKKNGNKVDNTQNRDTVISGKATAIELMRSKMNLVCNG